MKIKARKIIAIILMILLWVVINAPIIFMGMHLGSTFKDMFTFILEIWGFFAVIVILVIGIAWFLEE